MEDERMVFRTKWVKITGVILLLIPVLLSAGVLRIDIAMIEPNRITEQYKEAMLQIDKTVFGEDPLLQKCEVKMDIDRCASMFVGDDTVWISDTLTAHLNLSDHPGEYKLAGGSVERDKYVKDKYRQLKTVCENIRRSTGYDEAMSQYADSKPSIFTRHNIIIHLEIDGFVYLYKEINSSIYHIDSYRAKEDKA